MVGDVTELVRREIAAAEVVEGRLRALELVVAGGEHRFLGPALDDLERACERLSALELARTLVVTSGGSSADTSASELADGASVPADGARLTAAADALRAATVRLDAARSRAREAVESATKAARVRLQAVGALAAGA